MKLVDCLPIEVASRLITLDDLREIRIRNGCAVKLNVGGVWYYLNTNGSLATSDLSALKVGSVCDEIVKKACANSVYAYEKKLSNGYFTLQDGVRVGVCGHIFGADKRVFQHYTSLCFRIPHYVRCVTDFQLAQCERYNTVVLGAPSAGKTTFLRDVAVRLGRGYNVLVADERGELFYDDELTEGSNCDVLKWADKSYAFDVGVRAMSPQYFVCDELTERDVPFVRSCIASGVKLICSAHAISQQDFDKRFGILSCFEFVVNLNDKSSKTL